MRYQLVLTTLKKLSVFGMKPGLHRIRALLEGLGNPQQNLKVVLIGGTNGKGSVCAYLSSILSEAGYKVGMYTSPHLIDYPERIKINGQDIPRRQFSRLFQRVYSVAKKIKDRPTVFEILTAMAILYFKQKGVDLALMEVGLGGTYDATNILDPLFSVITNVELDHTEVLGKTLAKIARDKAGIVRSNSVLVTGADKGAVLKVLKEVCRQHKTKLIRADRTKRVSSRSGNQSSPVPGYQTKNLAIVKSCVKVLNQLAFEIPGRAIKSGMKKTFWPGRYQVLSQKPLVILDGAHNPAGARALSIALNQQSIPQPAVLIFGAIKNKDVDSMLKYLSPTFEVMFITDFNYPDALSPKKLVSLAAIKKPTTIFSSPLLALRKAKQSGFKTVVVCGSLYMVGDLLKQLTN
ncbi:MAG: bifunctional folylpolyglutamate synthase/dihydrofolate synthase [Candidatus Margulisbacteria bacterium]|nr:bifunctional folylpolyglutamate synthase/dihydrofolate synthase [Candidatus Margulisiibacteriota bacterium]MBU1021465.1 bifunctional folylpolyglutamate synthase/dihydrofolate synthase [Candidatus Margulisiibacteriota bacterium]MBU1728386.1 bifunctional folylpolyglutamate synthase/dihydrofolate synthase [Candidatus Margulisiibacteriota bacterium]MBU1955871.1 bifunctional folylpolyglutamate synthase/dihydrofolate synthase [Candidatus Margulisiibacteriota bacterium]